MIITTELTNYFLIPHGVLEDERFIKLNSSVKVVFFYMAKYQNRFNQKELFYRILDDICCDTGLSRATVVNAIKTLIDIKLLIVEKKGNHSFKNKKPNQYSIQFLFEVKMVQKNDYSNGCN